MEVVVSIGAIRLAKHQSNCHHQQTNTQLVTGRMPFLSPNQQCQSTEWKVEGHLSVKKLSIGMLVMVISLELGAIHLHILEFWLPSPSSPSSLLCFRHFQHK